MIFTFHDPFVGEEVIRKKNFSLNNMEPVLGMSFCGQGILGEEAESRVKIRLFMLFHFWILTEVYPQEVGYRQERRRWTRYLCTWT